jgi:hypothetical protein
MANGTTWGKQVPIDRGERLAARTLTGGAGRQGAAG